MESLLAMIFDIFVYSAFATGNMIEERFFEEE